MGRKIDDGKTDKKVTGLFVMFKDGEDSETLRELIAEKNYEILVDYGELGLYIIMVPKEQEKIAVSYFDGLNDQGERVYVKAGDEFLRIARKDNIRSIDELLPDIAQVLLTGFSEFREELREDGAELVFADCPYCDRINDFIDNNYDKSRGGRAQIETVNSCQHLVAALKIDDLEKKLVGEPWEFNKSVLDEHTGEYRVYFRKD